MKTVYMVKKNPSLPDNKDNWILMNIAEFAAFSKTPAAKGRYFADVGGHENSEIWYIVECPKPKAILWESELNRHRYLKRMECESKYKTVSYNLLEVDGEIVNSEDLIADPDCDVVAEVLLKLDIDTLHKALQSLTDDEYELIYQLYLSGTGNSEREYCRNNVFPQKTINDRKNSILRKLKKFF